MIRLAEYYFDQAEEEYFAQNENYDRQYEEYLQRLDQYYDGNLAEEPVAPAQPAYDYTRVIEIYDKILTEFTSANISFRVLGEMNGKVNSDRVLRGKGS